MDSFEVVDEKYVPLATVKEILKKVKNPTFEQKQAYQHARNFSKLKESEAQKLMEELKALEIRKLKDDMIVKIVDILPETAKELKSIVSISKVSFKQDEIEKILEIVKKYVKV